MFDCVLPTRAGRHGLAYTRFGKLNMKNARHADDIRPIDAASECPAARDYSRAYIHHLVKAGEALGPETRVIIFVLFPHDPITTVPPLATSWPLRGVHG
ncbi:MAG: tRNA-guanine transglycosylase, partial [Akkermansiaceae bacterium]|nr:tRNA-guanine transglycosylase [Akkermansiaceae bacterium]